MPAPGRKRGKTKLHRAAQEARPPSANSYQPADEWAGRLASEVETRTPDWMVYPWIPRALLSLVVGNPCVGKSSFIAALISHATGGHAMEDLVKPPNGKVVFLPGAEEDLEVMTVPRLRAAGAVLSRVKIVTDPSISLVRHKAVLARTVQSFGAKLLVGDPIDSYIDEEFSENDGQAVRPLLEAAAWIARETSASVVFARHPGKNIDNVMPGSRAWRAVPRSIVLLTSDGGIPPRFILSHYKDSLGTGSSPRHYCLRGKSGEAPRFELGEDIDRSGEDLSRSGGGPTGRFKLMLACRLVRWFFAEEAQPTRVKLGEHARQQGLGEDTLNDALRLLGVRAVPPARRGDPWHLVNSSGEWPSWLPDESTPL